MQAGRPVLIVPTDKGDIDLERALVGWKDTRETRRAISDALPVLKQAAHVSLVEVAPDDLLADARARLEDVAAWLMRHGIRSESLAVSSTGEDSARLQEIAQEQMADVIIAGAYGHSRVREWVLGGVTKDLLLRGDRCALVSH